MKICLDAGHYGKRNQSPVVPEYYESDMTWKLYRKLRAALEAYGFEVIGTRTSQDQDIALVTRGRMSAGCVAFISLHSNACGTESVDRPEGIYTMGDDKAKNMAALLADTVRNVMGTKDAAKTYQRVGDDRDGDGKNDDYYGVLYGAATVNTPGIILEHSFHTNTRAAKWLMDDNNLNELARAEAETLAKYFGLSGGTQDDGQMYRIRKSWNDAKSQVGAYRNLENAKNACPDGYTVYDKKGVPVYPVKDATPAKNTDVVLEYAVKTQDHGWLNLSEHKGDYAGWNNSPIIAVAMRVNKGRVKYRVHVAGGGWLNWITGCDLNDYNSGYAGNNKPIDAIQVYYYTPDDIRPYKRAKYRVMALGRNEYWGWQYDDETKGGQDGYAGALFGTPLVRLQAIIE